MAEASAEVSRSAAQELIDLDPNLPALVEAQLQGTAGGAPSRYELATEIALAALVVQIAQFGWQIYHDLKSGNQEPARDVVRRRIRIKVEAPTHVTEQQRGRIIDTVVDEIYRHPAR
jgi:hypothetical protein